MRSFRAIAAVTTLVLVAAPAAAESWKRPDSPFVLGEAQANTPATCTTVERWIDLAPEFDGRITFAITGKLVLAKWDGALGYLLMCDEKAVQVMCVTYGIEGRTVGEDFVLVGGYQRVGEKGIMLDPCLASPADRS